MRLPGGASGPGSAGEDPGTPKETLPPDIDALVRPLLGTDEEISSVLFADISPEGDFKETWVFLTNHRVFTLVPDGGEGDAAVEFEMPLERIEKAEIEKYVGSCALLVADAERAHEIARFSLGSIHEATDSYGTVIHI